MWYVPYVGFAIYRRVTVKIRLYFKGLMFMQMIYIYIYIYKRVVTKGMITAIGFVSTNAL
jgi:hypothetical protein